MRFLMRLAFAVGLLGLAGHALAADPTSVAPADQAAIQNVIRQQLDAFRKDDGAAAFAFASPGIQAQFAGDPDSFMGMVRRLYHPVYRSRNTAFGAAIVQDGQMVQKLEIVGEDGVSHEALYFMEHEPDGSWRISGCVLTDSGSVGA